MDDDGITASICDLLMICWIGDPLVRLTFNEIFNYLETEASQEILPNDSLDTSAQSLSIIKERMINPAREDAWQKKMMSFLALIEEEEDEMFEKQAQKVLMERCQKRMEGKKKGRVAKREKRAWLYLYFDCEGTGMKRGCITKGDGGGFVGDNFNII